MYQYAIDNGFAARCNARGITDPTQVQGLMKVAHDLVSQENQQIQKQAAEKQALSSREQSMLIGGLGGAGLGAGLGGLLGGWEGAAYGGLGGAGLGVGAGLGYDALRGGGLPETLPEAGLQKEIEEAAAGATLGGAVDGTVDEALADGAVDPDLRTFDPLTKRENVSSLDEAMAMPGEVVRAERTAREADEQRIGKKVNPPPVDPDTNKEQAPRKQQ